MQAAAPRRRRSGGRKGHANRAGGAAISQMRWRIPVNLDAPVETLSEAGEKAIFGPGTNIPDAAQDILHLFRVARA